MIIILDPLVLSISGRLGNSVYYPNGKRQFARRYVVPCNPDTASQRCRRGLFSSAVAKWQNLPSYKKEQWKMKALSHRISGYNLFISKTLRQKDEEACFSLYLRSDFFVCIKAGHSVSPVSAAAGLCMCRSIPDDLSKMKT